MNVRAAAFALAALAIVEANQLGDGTFRSNALALVTIALVASLAGVVAPARGRAYAALYLLAAGVFLETFELLRRAPGWNVPSALWPFQAGVVVLALVALAGIALGGQRWWIALLFAPQLALGVWMIARPLTVIDVNLFHLQAFDALRRHSDPYGGTIPNIYAGLPFYSPEVVAGGRVLAGFPYPPLSLLVAFAAQVAFGNHRLAWAASAALAGILIASTRPGRLAWAAGAVFLLAPRTFFVLEQSWTEPLVTMLLAATVLCACRAPRLLPWVLGLFLAAKQYAVLALPATVLLVPRPFSLRLWLRLVAPALLVAATVTLPFFLWSPAAFIRDVLLFQVRQPLRLDALSFVALLVRQGIALPVWTPFAAAAGAAVVALLFAPRAPEGFAAGAALTYLAFFAFAKQAFCNYYYFVGGAICCAVAAVETAEAGDESARRLPTYAS